MIPGDTPSLDFEYWKVTGGGNYFTVDSYLDGDDIKVPLSDVPFYNEIPLNQVLDFRYIEEQNRISLDPYSTIDLKTDYYLSRTDVLTVDADGQFNIIEGQSSEFPKRPIVPNDSMELYEFGIPEYTFNIAEIDLTQKDNTRYTMQDIGKISKRLEVVEENVSLSLLELSAKNDSIYDSTGIERFKNGFLVDSFYDYSVADISDYNFQASFDLENGRLMPYHNGDLLKLSSVGSPSTAGFKFSGVSEDALTLP